MADANAPSLTAASVGGRGRSGGRVRLGLRIGARMAAANEPSCGRLSARGGAGEMSVDGADADAGGGFWGWRGTAGSNKACGAGSWGSLRVGCWGFDDGDCVSREGSGGGDGAGRATRCEDVSEAELCEMGRAGGLAVEEEMYTLSGSCDGCFCCSLDQQPIAEWLRTWFARGCSTEDFGRAVPHHVSAPPPPAVEVAGRDEEEEEAAAASRRSAIMSWEPSQGTIMAVRFLSLSYSSLAVLAALTAPRKMKTMAAVGVGDGDEGEDKGGRGMLRGEDAGR